MTNPDNAVGTNGAFGGRTSVNAFNDVMGAFQSRGILSGWGIVPSSGMTVSVGGNGTTRDVAVAEDASGNKTSINNISGAPISVTLDSAPASNSRYDAIVAYVDKPPIGNSTQDNPECCGIIAVTGMATSTPSYPSDNDIRNAITNDNASGATAYYAVLGYVLVASGTTSITSGMITNGPLAVTNVMVDTAHIQNGAVTDEKITYNSVDFTSSVTFNEGTPASYTTFIKVGNIVYIDYQGASKAHSVNDNLFTIPSAYRPQTRKQINCSFGGLYPGLILLGTNGVATLNQKSAEVGTSTYRIYAQISYPLS